MGDVALGNGVSIQRLTPPRLLASERSSVRLIIVHSLSFIPGFFQHKSLKAIHRSFLHVVTNTSGESSNLRLILPPVHAQHLATA